MTSLNRIIAAIAAVQLGVRAVSAQKNDSFCVDSRFEHLNASASYPFPAFRPPGDTSSNDSTWSLSTGVVTWGGNTTQRIWIDTSPAVEVESSSLPYQGCIIALLSLTADTSEGGQNNNGDCKSTLGEECVTAILKNTNVIARNYSEHAAEDLQMYLKSKSIGSNKSFAAVQCENFPLSVIPTECGNHTTLFTYIPIIGGRPPIWINDTLAKESNLDEPQTCPNPGNGNAASSPLFQFNNGTNFSNRDYNYSTYNQWVNRVLPVLVPVWSKHFENGSIEAWGDSRLICMRPEASTQPSLILAAPSLGVKEVSYTRAMALGFVLMTTALLLIGWM